MFETGKDAASIVDKKGLKQVSDSGAIEALVDTVIAANMTRSKNIAAARTSYLGFSSGR